MDSISKAIIILRWKSNTQVDILSRKLTQKCDVTEQRMAVKFVLAPKVNFWDVGFAVLTYIWSVWYEGYIIQVVWYFYWKRLPITLRFLFWWNVSWSLAAGIKCTFDTATFSNQFKFPILVCILQVLAATFCFNFMYITVITYSVYHKHMCIVTQSFDVFFRSWLPHYGVSWTHLPVYVTSELWNSSTCFIRWRPLPGCVRTSSGMLLWLTMR